MSKKRLLKTKLEIDSVTNCMTLKEYVVLLQGSATVAYSSKIQNLQKNMRHIIDFLHSKVPELQRLIIKFQKYPILNYISWHNSITSLLLQKSKKVEMRMCVIESLHKSMNSFMRRCVGKK